MENDYFLWAFGQLTNAMEGGGNRGRSFPQSDADDLRNGARFIPGEVTMARRQGEEVNFCQTCSPCCWYWKMPNGDRIYHFDSITYDELKKTGKCSNCGNENIGGGIVKV